MNLEEKVMIAKQLARLGVDIIEAGFAYSSPGDFEAVRQIAQQVEGPTICSLARARPEDIDRAWEALKGASSHTMTSVGTLIGPGALPNYRSTVVCKVNPPESFTCTHTIVTE